MVALGLRLSETGILDKPGTANSNNFGFLEPSHIRIEVLQFCVARQLEVVADQHASRLGLESPSVLCQMIIEIVPT